MSGGSGPRVFRDRQEAGEALGERLSRFAGDPAVVVLGVPRGGLPVAFEVARSLAAPLDVFVVRKLGVPGSRELAMGAIASGGIRVINDEVVAWFGIGPETIESVARAEQLELDRRERVYRGGRAMLPLEGRVAVLVDDGLATGSTMRATVQAVRQLAPARVIVAVPVGARDTCESLRSIADEVICLSTPDHFEAVGQWYENFAQTTDEEVKQLLAAARDRELRADR